MTQYDAHRLLRLSLDKGDRVKQGRTPGLWLVSSATHDRTWWRVEHGRCKCPAARLGRPCRHIAAVAFVVKRRRLGDGWALGVLAAIGRAPAGVVDLGAERARRSAPAVA